MDVQTLLTRQMELHTSMRHPPMTEEQLLQLRTTMRGYNDFFFFLRTLAGQLTSDPVTVFQCLMQLGMGGVVSFDRQHQDGSVPMHQAKVLARTEAMALEPLLRQNVPAPKLAACVERTKDLRSRLRVKVEDGNDLKAVEKAVRDSLEYLDFIYECAGGRRERMFAFYMVEDEAALRALLHEAGRGDGDKNIHNNHQGSDSVTAVEVNYWINRESAMQTRNATYSAVSSSAPTMTTSPAHDRRGGAGPAPASSDVPPLPDSNTDVLEAMTTQGEVMAAVRRPAAERLLAAQTLITWCGALPTGCLVRLLPRLLVALEGAVAVVICEKRSALCRAGCDLVVALLHRLAEVWPLLDTDTEPQRGPGGVGPTLALWAGGLTRGVFVTVAAISAATDRTLRELVICTNGHVCVVRAIVKALEAGSHAELRRRCLGYLALALSAASADAGGLQHPPPRTRILTGGGSGACSQYAVHNLGALLEDVARRYVTIGDSPSRKMARVLCALLRVLYHPACTRGTIEAKVERMIEQEQDRVSPVARDPRQLDELLFNTSEFISSTRTVFSTLRPRDRCVDRDGGADGRCDTMPTTVTRSPDRALRTLPPQNAQHEDVPSPHPALSVCLSPSLRQKIAASRHTTA